MVFGNQKPKAAEEIRFIHIQVVGEDALIELVEDRYGVKLSAGDIVVSAFGSDLFIVAIRKLSGFLVELIEVGIGGKQGWKKIELSSGSDRNSKISWNQGEPPRPLISEYIMGR